MKTENIAILDIETTWKNHLMSIGIVIAADETLEIVDKRYYILLPNKYEGGMYIRALYINGVHVDKEGSRQTIIEDIKNFLKAHNVQRIFAYNALFDYGQLPELDYFKWYDIMKVAAYKQYNYKIPIDAECFKTGRLKHGYGVEKMYRLLSGNYDYFETHNALLDAIDELAIMRMMNRSMRNYELARICIYKTNSYSK